MELRPKIHIYDRRELGVLFFLAVVVSLFSFTLGIHMGRRAGSETEKAAAAEPVAIAHDVEPPPSSQDLNQQARTAHQVADQALDQTLHDEVMKTGIKLEKGHQLELPDTVRAHAQPQGKFTLQVGSYPSEADAQKKIEGLEAKGLKPFLRSVEISGKGSWYRVYIGGFASKLTAEAEGTDLQSQHKIDSFIVANLPE